MDERLPADHRARELLADLGFTDYEAACLVAAMQYPGATATDIARHSSLPRSRVYDVADQLAADGYLEVREGDPKEYRPIPAGEIQATLQDRYDRAVSDLGTALSEIDEQEPMTPRDCSVWSFSGRRASLSRSWELLERTTDRAWMLVRPGLLSEDCIEALRGATDRGVTLRLAVPDTDIRDWLAERVPAATIEDVPPALVDETGDEPLVRILVTDDDAVLTVTRCQETPASPTEYVGCMGQGEQCGFVRSHRLLLGLDPP